MLSLVGPDRCVACAAPGAAVCPGCRRRLVVCPALDAPPPLARLVAGFLYVDAARSLVLGLKLRGLRGCAEPLAEAVCHNAWRQGIGGDLVTWVPGTPADVRRRGYDHAEVLARSVASRLGLPARALLAPARARRDQTGLDAAQRRANLKGAFVALPVQGEVVLVDDVMTTGATICACAGALLRSGAGAVAGLVGCRA